MNEENDSTTTSQPVIPEGTPKSGRVWKKKQVYRSSTIKRKGVLHHLAKSLEEKKLQRDREREVKRYERELKSETNSKKEAERYRRIEQQRRREANEYKTATYQEVKPEKLKGMSKKQLRTIRRTAVNKQGQMELVSPYGR
jgi:hypothetical protein